VYLRRVMLFFAFHDQDLWIGMDSGKMKMHIIPTDFVLSVFVIIL
jgi:hypothetical protein